MIRLATIGTSWITESLVEAVGLVDGITVTTVFSRDEARGRAFASGLGVPRVSCDLDELLLDPEIDAVYVASPNSVHAEQVMAALGAGKHVLVEKPAVTTAEAWARLRQEASAHGVVLLEAMRTAYDPGLDVIRDLIPTLGTVRRVRFSYEKRSSRYDLVLAGERVNIFDPALAGGALLDLGVYCIHALVSLFGEPAAVQAAHVTIASGADGAGTALCTYPGFVAEVCYSKITTSTLPSEIQGEQATLLIDSIASPTSLTVQLLDGSSTTRALPPLRHTLADEVQRFVELVDGDGDAAYDQELTAATLRVTDGIRRV
ncbi:MAG: Gfo/Idh/MocA family oxidoreductase [Actinobacteria bacterium]|nr:Gfo/Idh/MocA family oxidoreductase [Actinomycetota bacterium]